MSPASPTRHQHQFDSLDIDHLLCHQDPTKHHHQKLQKKHITDLLLDFTSKHYY